MPGWRNSRRRHTLPKAWPKIRHMVLVRDHYRCQHIRVDTGERCGAPANQVDHIVRPADGGTDALDNLRALCAWHHRQKSSAEGAAESLRRRRTGSSSHHPGSAPE